MMNLKRLKILRTAIICLTQLACFLGIGQTNTHSSKIMDVSLYDEIYRVDSLFFSAYNNIEIDTYKSFLAEDIEFFHDKNGFIDSKKRIIASYKKIENAKKNTSYSIKRRLIENSLEVYKIPGFGALEIGLHQFTETNKNNKILITQAKFIHLWKKQNDSWIITKVFSFDHQPIKVKISPNEKVVYLTNKQLKTYTGSYQFAPEFVLKIVQEGHKLFGLAQGDKIEIIPYGSYKFLISRDNSKLKFLVNDKNIVIGIEMQTKKGTMKAKKIIKQ